MRGIAIKGYTLGKDGKLKKKPSNASVSQKIKQKTSKKVRCVKPVA